MDVCLSYICRLCQSWFVEKSNKKIILIWWHNSAPVWKYKNSHNLDICATLHQRRVTQTNLKRQRMTGTESRRRDSRSANVFWPNGPIPFSFVVRSLLIHIKETRSTSLTAPGRWWKLPAASPFKCTEWETEELTWKQRVPESLQPVTVCVHVCVHERWGRRAVNHVTLHCHTRL